jgi:hypothetical protein
VETKGWVGNPIRSQLAEPHSRPVGSGETFLIPDKSLGEGIPEGTHPVETGEEKRKNYGANGHTRAVSSGFQWKQGGYKWAQIDVFIIGPPDMTGTHLEECVPSWKKILRP